MKKIAPSSFPLPGRPVRGSSTGRPVMAALDLLGRRWTLRVLWELRSETMSFRALQSACEGVVPSVLNTRLAELRELDLVEATDDGYALTTQGRALGELLVPLDAWATRWAKGLERAALPK